MRFVAEGHVLEFHASFDARQGHGLLGVLHVGFGVEHLEDALRGGQRAREEVRDAAHELQRTVEQAQVAEEGEKLTEREGFRSGNSCAPSDGILNDLIPADVPDGQVADAHDEEEHREERDPHVFGGDVGVVKLHAVLVESLDFAVLLGESADDAYAGKAIADGRGQAAVQMPGPPPNVHHAIPEELREQEDDRRGNKDQKRELPVHPEAARRRCRRKRRMFEKKFWMLSTSTASSDCVSRVTRAINAPGWRLSKYLSDRLCKMAEDVVAKLVRERWPKRTAIRPRQTPSACPKNCTASQDHHQPSEQA